MKRMITLSTVTMLGFFLPGAALAQTAKDLVGTWTNTSNVNVRVDGTRTDVFGANGKGTIIFKVEGRTWPAWAGTEQKRTIVSFTGDEIKWTLPASIGGTGEVGWKRVK